MCLICIGLGYKKTLKYNYGKVGNTTRSREIDFGKNEQGDGKFRAGRRETVKMSREKGDGFQAGRRGL